jgi:hypothetical protein
MKKIFPLILIFIVLPIALLMLLWRDSCRETVVGTSVSPDGERMAVITNKDCGPAVAVATEVRLGIRDPRTERNFKAGTSQAILLQGVIDTKLNWKSPRQLQIAFPIGSTIVMRRPEIDGVKLTFSDK